MATKNPTASKTRRASQRLTVSIDLSSDDLKRLMIEQCFGDGGNYLTVYRGMQTEFIAAGVPATAFPANSDSAEFKLQTINVCWVLR